MIEIQFKALLLYLNFPVIPAKAGIQLLQCDQWIPAFAGMTNEKLLPLTLSQGFFV